MYTKLNMIFYKFIMAEANSGPPKWQQYSPASSGWSLLLPNPEPGGNEPIRGHISPEQLVEIVQFLWVHLHFAKGVDCAFFGILANCLGVAKFWELQIVNIVRMIGLCQSLQYTLN